MRFLNRSDELAMLRRRLEGDSAELLVVYGRRRIGKTELLNHWVSDVRAFYFEATDTVATQQLQDLGQELARESGNQLLSTQPLTSWEAALTAITDYVGDQRTLVVLDEFQLLAQQSSELESTLSRWWRTTGRNLPIVLVLAGSELSFFEDSVLAGRLYGRRTGQLKLEPFLARHAALFHPGYSAQDRVRTYSVCGGVPYYLERFHDRRSLAEHLLIEVFERTGLLHNEAELMLRQSIVDPTNHIAVLRAIAHGHNKNSAITARTGLSASNVNRVIGILERLGLIEILRPITTSTRTKKTAYAISDQFLRFHYRFVEPARSQLRTSELASEYLHDTVLAQLDQHASIAWEEICRQHVHQATNATAVGRWWGQVPTGDGRRSEEREVDVVGVDGHRKPVALGMCKWTTTPVDFDELNLLQRLAVHIPGTTGSEEIYLFSRAGFTKRLIAHSTTHPNLNLLTAEDIYR